MTFLFDARHSVVLLRQKIGYTLDPKCSNVDLYREMASVKFSEIYSPRSRVPLCTGVFFPNADGYLVPGKLNSGTKRPGGGGKKNKN